MKNTLLRLKPLLVFALLLGLSPIRSAHADAADQHKEASNVYHDAGRFDAALKEYREAIHLRPHFPKAYNNIGSVYIDEGEDKLAIALLLTAIQQDPKYAHAYYNLGKAYADLGKPEQAITAYNQAAKLDPTDPDTFHNLAGVYVMSEQWDKAVKPLQEAIRLSPTFSYALDAHQSLASAYTHLGQDDQALQEYQQILATQRTDPNFAVDYYNFGYVLSDKGRHPEAIAAFLQSIHLRPTYRPHINLGIEYITTKQWGQAVETLREAVHLNPSSPEAYFNLGVALSGGENQAGARTQWQKVLTLDHGEIARAAKARLAGSATAK